MVTRSFEHKVEWDDGFSNQPKEFKFQSGMTGRVTDLVCEGERMKLEIAGRYLVGDFPIDHLDGTCTGLFIRTEVAKAQALTRRQAILAELLEHREQCEQSRFQPTKMLQAVQIATERRAEAEVRMSEMERILHRQVAQSYHDNVLPPQYGRLRGSQAYEEEWQEWGVVLGVCRELVDRRP